MEFLLSIFFFIHLIGIWLLFHCCYCYCRCCCYLNKMFSIYSYCGSTWMGCRICWDCCARDGWRYWTCCGKKCCCGRDNFPPPSEFSGAGVGTFTTISVGCRTTSALKPSFGSAVYVTVRMNPSESTTEYDPLITFPSRTSLRCW